jgi:hypothetical protein
MAEAARHATGRMWLDEEDEILINTIQQAKQMGLQIKQAFEEASLALTSVTPDGRTPAMCKQHWYSTLYPAFKRQEEQEALKALLEEKEKAIAEALVEKASEKGDQSAPPSLPKNVNVTLSGAGTERKPIWFRGSAANEHAVRQASATQASATQSDNQVLSTQVSPTQVSVSGSQLQNNKEQPTQNGSDPGAKHFFEGDTKDAEVVNIPFIKVEIKPITKQQLLLMATPELYDLLLNVTVEIQERNDKVMKHNEKLQRDLLIETREKEEMKVGYTSLLGVINTARNLAIAEDSSRENPRFKMDSNGNLERI